MRRSKEIMLLLALFVGLAAFVLWYVADRRAKNRAAPPVATQTLTPETATRAPEPVVLGPETERKTVDFSSGQPVVKDSAEDKAAIDAALKDMAEATKGVTFDAAPKKPAAPAPAKK